VRRAGFTERSPLDCRPRKAEHLAAPQPVQRHAPRGVQALARGRTNEDRIIIAKADDVILYEGNPRAEAFRDTKADQLSILLRVHNYVAVHASRYPLSLAVISGTGLATPDW